MNSNFLSNQATSTPSENGLLTDIYSFLSEFIEGDIDTDEFSSLLDMHIELSAEY